MNNIIGKQDENRNYRFRKYWRKFGHPPGQRRAIPYAGDHEPSLEKLETLIADIGFDPVYVGPLSESHIIDPEQELYTKDVTAGEMKKILAQHLR